MFIFKSFTRTVLILGTTVGLVLAVPAAAGPENEAGEFNKIKLIEGTDPTYESKVQRMIESDPNYQKERAADRALVKAERKAMKKDGYIVTDEQNVDLHDAAIFNPHIVDQAEVMPLLGFVPTALNLGYEVAGMLYDVSDDGKAHDVTTILKHYDLGYIRVRERSIATEPKGKRAKYLYGPKFDLKVNGSPALLRVYQTEDGLKGRSDLSVLTETKLYTVGVGTALLKDDPNYATLFAVASELQ